MYYNRKVSTGLATELRREGAFGFLLELTRTWHLVDLQLRSYPGKSRCWATLYVGLTKVLDVIESQGIFRLSGKVNDPAWDPNWEQGHPAEWFHSQSENVAAYVRGAIGKVPERFTKEGAVQAMLCTSGSSPFSVIDREAVVGFDDTASRTATYDALQSPLLAACPPDAAEPWFKPKSFGGELDLLAVDGDGRILVVEVKPGSATSGIAWAPLQATFYARLFRAWAEEEDAKKGDEASRKILQSMLAQRIDLGLTHKPAPAIRTPIEIVPVVAIGGEPPSPRALPRLRRVQSALLDAGVGEAGLQVWIVEETVECRPVPDTASPGGS